MASRVIILAGAPDCSALDWSTDGLFSEFQACIAQFMGINANSELPPPALSAPEHAAWRLLSLDKGRPFTRASQEHAANFNHGPDESVFGPSPEFLNTTVSLSFVSDRDDGEQNPVLSQLYEHSMAAHDELSSSQLISQSTEQVTSFLSDDTSSFLSGEGDQGASIKGPLLFRGSEVLTNLKSFPSAAYLLKIHPQTMTFNLIVGIISISRPRAVKTRWGATKYLVEVLVGDETKAGFAVTYWLPYDSVDKSPLAGLRSRDVVFIQNVALNVFNNKVYGSSLRKNVTKVHLLYRVKLDPQDAGGYYSTFDLSFPGSVHPQLDKTRRVRDWVRNFVGRGGHETETASTKPRWDKPPADDTQLL
jgi:hypothetical protein